MPTSTNSHLNLIGSPSKVPMVIKGGHVISVDNYDLEDNCNNFYSFSISPGSPECELLGEPLNRLTNFYMSGTGNKETCLRLRQEFVDKLCEQIDKRLAMSTASFKFVANNLILADSFSCAICYGALCDPITIQCGHSYCRKCIQKVGVGAGCKRCKSVVTSQDVNFTKTNVLLATLVEKWWPNFRKTMTLRNEGNSLFREGKTDEAIRKYTQAISLSK